MSIYQLLSKYYDDLFPAKEATVDFLSRQLADRKGVLDIGCGTGSHCIALSERGFQVTGADPDPQMIEKAREKISGTNPLFFTAGLGSLPSLGDVYNGIYCIGNTLVHLPDREAVRRSFQEVFDILLPGGCYIIQIVNYDRIFRDSVTSLPPLEGEKAVLNRHYTLADDGTRVEFEIELVVKGDEKKAAEKGTVDLLALKKGELTDWAEAAGFVDIQVYGSFQGDGFSLDRGATILVVGKEQT
jgi:SAM-dependent methyltransferase